MYIELIQEFISENKYISIQPSASRKQIAEAEMAMKVIFPDEIKQMLSELNGDKWLCFSCDEIVKNNIETRKYLSEYYDGLDNLLFIAGNGCGDYYGYIIEDGSCVDGKIIMWEHETNEIHIVADSLQMLIHRYYSDEI